MQYTPLLRYGGTEFHLSLLTCVLHDVWLTSRSGLLYLVKGTALKVNLLIRHYLIKA